MITVEIIVARCVSLVNFAEYLGTHFLQNTTGRLLLLDRLEKFWYRFSRASHVGQVWCRWELIGILKKPVCKTNVNNVLNGRREKFPDIHLWVLCSREFLVLEEDLDFLEKIFYRTLQKVTTFSVKLFCRTLLGEYF